MQFELSEEQRMLRDLIDKFAGDRYDPVRRLSYVRADKGFSQDGWQQLADLGVLAFPLSPDSGGFGGGSVELITVMEALGRGVMTEPVLPVVVMAATLLERAGTPAQKDRWLPALVSGSAFAAVAHAEPQARFNEADVATRAAGPDAAPRLSGSKRLALGGAYAGIFVVSARDAAGQVRLYLVEAGAPGLRTHAYRLSDGSLACDVALADAPAEPMAGDATHLADVVESARLAVCAELVGLMTMMFDATLDYVKTRRQFGSAIGSFQAIQHRMADNYARLELARSQLYRAAADDAAPGTARGAAAGAKAYISAKAMQLGEDAIQLHGGIGTTEELMVGQAFKRTLLLASLFGDADWELRRYMRGRSLNGAGHSAAR